MQPTGRAPAPNPGQGPVKKEPVKEEPKEVKGVKSLRERLAGSIPMAMPDSSKLKDRPIKQEQPVESEPPPPNRDAPAIPPRRAQMPLPLSSAPTDLPPTLPLTAPPPTRGLPAAPGQKPEPKKPVPQKTGMGGFHTDLKSNPLFAQRQAMEQVAKQVKPLGFEYNEETRMFVNKNGEGYTLEELKNELPTTKNAQLDADFALAMKMSKEYGEEMIKRAASRPQDVELSADEAGWALVKNYQEVFSEGVVVGYEEPDTKEFKTKADIKEAYNFEQLAATKGYESIAPGIFQNAHGDIVSADELKDIIYNS